MTDRRLLISSGGEIQCAEHAPCRGSGTWTAGRWRPIRVDERAEFAAEIGRQPTCETCDAIARKTKAGPTHAVQEFESGNRRNRCAGVFDGDRCVASFHIRDHGSKYAQHAQQEVDRLNLEASHTKAVTQ